MNIWCKIYLDKPLDTGRKLNVQFFATLIIHCTHFFEIKQNMFFCKMFWTWFFAIFWRHGQFFSRVSSWVLACNSKCYWEFLLKLLCWGLSLIILLVLFQNDFIKLICHTSMKQSMKASASRKEIYLALNAKQLTPPRMFCKILWNFPWKVIFKDRQLFLTIVLKIFVLILISTSLLNSFFFFWTLPCENFKAFLWNMAY